ncbi:leucine-rich repeat domain-containing protein [Microcoleus sp. Pol12B4]|uniref:leucine-rich repeat domain-containing protein n=1 Tax=Microcoleus sp. Pol12B4 TaxID=3055395 RepID=UPI002FD1C01D
MLETEGDREARQRIEEARREGARTLDLSYMELTELPEAIASLTQLQHFDLSRNELTELPDAIASLTQLQQLDLSDNQLMELPEAIGSLTQLKLLNLNDNKLTSLPNCLGNLNKLEKIQLSSNQLDEIPLVLRRLNLLKELYIPRNKLRIIPHWIGELQLLESLSLSGNQITNLPDSIKNLLKLKILWLGAEFPNIDSELQDLGNPLYELPSCLSLPKQIKKLSLANCSLTTLPNWLGELTELSELQLNTNNLADLPASLCQLSNIENLYLENNALNPDLAAAYQQSTKAVLQYLRAKAEAQVTLNEAKLILIGEGEVGKSCVLGALRGDEWVDGRPTTHGIEIKSVIVTDPDSGTEISLNGWDFGGQRVYRPTHQLFFSAPAVYLVIWKPREGPQQGFVKEWITLIKNREPDRCKGVGRRNPRRSRTATTGY